MLFSDNRWDAAWNIFPFPHLFCSDAWAEPPREPSSCNLGRAQLGSPKNWSLERVSALRSSLDCYPSSRGDHHHWATLASKKSSKKAHFGHFIYGIQCLSHGQITYNGKGVHKIPCMQIFFFFVLLFIIKKSWGKNPLPVWLVFHSKEWGP